MSEDSHYLMSCVFLLCHHDMCTAFNIYVYHDTNGCVMSHVPVNRADQTTKDRGSNLESTLFRTDRVNCNR